ncbi:MAG: phosphatase PAP2 family protein, partial [Thermomicrobiales bacterium]
MSTNSETTGGADATGPRGCRDVWPAWIAAAFASGLAWIAFLTGGFLVLGDHVAETPRVRFDERVSLALHDHASPGLTRAMKLATDLGSAYVTVPLILAAVFWLARRNRRRAAAIVTVAWIGAQLLDLGLKHFYHRDRPSLFPAFARAGGYSFPSGHTVTATVTYGLIAALVARELRGRSRWLPAIVAAIVVIAVATSRVYLG